MLIAEISGKIIRLHKRHKDAHERAEATWELLVDHLVPLGLDKTRIGERCSEMRDAQH
jgi:hypothetical protein